jgi:hypothetical protein
MESAFNEKAPNLGANQFLVIGFTSYDTQKQGPLFGVQLAISFGSNKIATRYAGYGSYRWGDWRLI